MVFIEQIMVSILNLVGMGLAQLVSAPPPTKNVWFGLKFPPGYVYGLTTPTSALSLMIELDQNIGSNLAICKHYMAIYNTPSVQGKTPPSVARLPAAQRTVSSR